MGEVNNGNRFSIDSLLSRPDPIRRRTTLFHGPYQPRGSQVQQHVSAISCGNSEGESAQMGTKMERTKQRHSETSADDDELGTVAVKRCHNEAFDCLRKQNLQQSPTHYQDKSRKTSLKSSESLCRYTSDDGLNPGPGSVINLIDMDRRIDYHGSFMEPRNELLKDSLRDDLTESFTEYEEDFTYSEKNEFPNKTKKQEEITIDGITISLQNSNLWRQFHHRGTEMIINRAGRRMFPRMSIRVTGLRDHVHYQVLLFFERSDRRRYKFVNGKWHTTQIMEFQEMSHIYAHPDSPNTGNFWMKDVICFSKLKITNDPEPDGSNVFLQSMYKYIPHIIIRENDTSDIEENFRGSPKSLRALSSHSGSCYDFCFPITSFIAVTAYQNERITHLKIKNNPFAKAFRESGKASLHYGFLGSGDISQYPQKAGFPLYHPLRNAESLGCMPTSSLPFHCTNWSDARMFMTKSLLHLSRATSSECRNATSLQPLPRSSQMYCGSNMYLTADKSPFLRNHSSSVTSLRPRLSSSTSSVLWEHDSAYGSLNSVRDHSA